MDILAHLNVIQEIPTNPSACESNHHFMITPKPPPQPTSRSECSTSSTVLTSQSSPISITHCSFECQPVDNKLVDTIVDYHCEQDDDNDRCQTNGVCFGRWIFNKMLYFESKRTNSPFLPTLQNDTIQALGRDNTTNLTLPSGTCDENIIDRLSCCDSKIMDSENTFSVASQCEDEGNAKASICYFETYLRQLQSLPQNYTPAIEFRKASVLHKLGCLQWQCGKYQLSLSALVESSAILDHLKEESSSLYTSPDVVSNLALASANILISKGRLHLSRGEGAAAMQCYRECVRRLSSVKCDRSQSG